MAARKVEGLSACAILVDLAARGDFLHFACNLPREEAESKRLPKIRSGMRLTQHEKND